MMGELQCDPADFKGRIIFMSMFNYIGMQKEMKNYVKIIQKELMNTLEDFLAVIGLSLDLVQKRSGTRHIQKQTKRMLGSDCGENNAKCPKIWSPNIPLYQCFGERTIKKQRMRKDYNTFDSK